MTKKKITTAEIWTVLLERAAADVGMTLEQAKKQLADHRILLSIRFIVSPKEGL